MAKKEEFKDETIKDLSLGTGLSFMTYDRSNFTGRVRMAVDSVEGDGMALGLSRLVLDTKLPDDFDREKYAVSGQLTVSLKVVIRKEWLEEEAKAKEAAKK